MQDVIVRAVSDDGSLKAMAICSTGLVERARQIHKTLPTATAALGRALTACSMMGSMQKIEDGSLTLQIKGGGPIGTLIATSDPMGNVRGWVEHPQISLMEKYRGKLDVGAAVGCDGTLTVIRDLKMKEPYVGSTALVSGEIAEDVTEYFAASEQIPTACALGVLVDTDQSVKAAGGYLIQLLPGAQEQTICRLEAQIQAAGAVTAMLDSGMQPEQILQKLLGEIPFTVLQSQPVDYRCYCSRDRVKGALVALGREELRQIVARDETLHVGCQFCDKDYTFTPADISEILVDSERAD